MSKTNRPCSLVSRALKRLGYRVLEACHAREALGVRQVHGPQIDLLFTDMLMPEGITGLELAEQLGAIKPTLKVVISSGYSDEMVAGGEPKAPHLRYLSKPYEIKALARVIRECLETHPSAVR